MVGILEAIWIASLSKVGNITGKYLFIHNCVQLQKIKVKFEKYII